MSNWSHKQFRDVLYNLCHLKVVSYYLLVMGDIEIFAYDDSHLKYHGYCKYHDTSKLVVTVYEHALKS